MPGENDAKRRRLSKQASFSGVDEEFQAQSVLSFQAGMDDDAIEGLLLQLKERDVSEITRVREQIIDFLVAETDQNERNRLGGWLGKFKKAIEEMQATAPNHGGPPSSILGSKIRSMGYGSSAGKHTPEINEGLESCAKDEPNKKGFMLAHPLYRSFLRHIYNNENNNNGAWSYRSFFSKRYADIWKNTDYGLVSSKNTNGSTPEPAATSLLCGTINQLIPVVLGEGDGGLKEWFPQWMSEFALKTSKTGQRDKEPRTDGILAAPDPCHQNALRALVTMEAKLSDFTPEDRAQSRSNACDAFTRQPSDARPWPLLVLRFVLGKSQCAVEAHAFVPDSETKARLVLLWKGSDVKAEAMYNCVVAALLASKDFLELLQQKRRVPLFCEVLNNVAFQEEEDTIYKSFFNTKRRETNIELVREFVDSNAKEVKLGEEGSYIEMSDVGPVLFDGERSCSVRRFIEVGNSLGKLHQEKAKTHGDIRLSNLILGGNEGKIVDWDLAGDTGKKFYPPGLKPIKDGARHADVEAAIRDKKVGELPLTNEHDWESLRAAMRCFEPIEQCHLPAWESLISSIDECTNRSEAREDFMVKLVKDVGELKTWTPCSQAAL